MVRVARAVVGDAEEARDLVQEAFIAAYRAFVEAYRIANATLRKGLAGFDFPEGGHPPVSCRICGAG